MNINKNDLTYQYDHNKYAINDAIVALAKHLNLSQRELSEATDIDKSKMSRFFNKKEIPNKEHLEKLSLPLKVSKETLWIISGDMLPPNKESIIISELQAIEKILCKNKDIFEEELGLDIKLTTTEKQLLMEFIGYLKYRRQ